MLCKMRHDAVRADTSKVVAAARQKRRHSMTTAAAAFPGPVPHPVQSAFIPAKHQQGLERLGWEYRVIQHFLEASPQEWLLVDSYPPLPLLPFPQPTAWRLLTLPSFFFSFFTLLFTTVVSKWNFSHGKFGLPSKESQLRQSRATQPTVYAGCYSVSVIHRTLTWTTGSLTCAQM